MPVPTVVRAALILLVCNGTNPGKVVFAVGTVNVKTGTERFRRRSSLPTTRTVAANGRRNLQSNDVGIPIHIDGSRIVTVPPVAYIGSQDNGEGAYEVQEDSVMLTGNVWKAFGFGGRQYVVTDRTVLEFDFEINKFAEIHAICLEGTNLNSGQAHNCFHLGGAGGDEFLMRIGPPNQIGEAKSYRIEVGRRFHSQSERPITAIALISDSDTDPTVGDSTFSNIRLFEDETIQNLIIEVRDVDFAIGSSSFPYASVRTSGGVQDSGGGRFQTSENGKAITLFGNAWKGFNINAYQVTDRTVLEFQLQISQLTEQHAICLDGDDRRAVGVENNCFFLGGTETGSWLMRLDPVVSQSSEPQSVRIEVGRRFFQSSEKLVNSIAFISDSDANVASGESTFSNIRLYDEESFSNLKMKISGEDFSITSSSFSYASVRTSGGIQDSGGGQFEISSNGRSVTLHGNAWKGFLINAYPIRDETVLEFNVQISQLAEQHVICLDGDDRRAIGVENNCFYLGGTETGSWLMRLDPPLGQSTEAQSVRIEVGRRFFQSSEKIINNIAFISDNDAFVSLGETVFSNIRLFDDEKLRKLKIKVNGRNFVISTSSISYASVRTSGGIQDSGGGWFETSQKGKAITLHGNAWKGFLINSYQVTDQTVLEFRVHIIQVTEQHVICLDGDDRRAVGMENNCFYLGGTETGNWLMRLDPPIAIAETTNVRIDVGRFFHGASEKLVNVIGLVSDSDAILTLGETTFSNIRLYEDSNLPRLTLEIGGEPFVIATSSLSYASVRTSGGVQDSGGGRFEISKNGKGITLVGNAWKAFEIESYVVTEDTILEFDFEIEEVGRSHAICLDGDDRRFIGVQNNCFYLGGVEVGSFTMQIDPLIGVGEKRRYEIPVGELFGDASENPVNVIAFVSDNDSNIASGRSTFSNVKLHEGDIGNGGDDGNGGDPGCKDSKRDEFSLLIDENKIKTCRWLVQKKKAKQRTRICNSSNSNAIDVCPCACGVGSE